MGGGKTGGRLAIYEEVSQFLNNLSNEEFTELLSEKKGVEKIGGETKILNVKNTKVFVKIMPLTKEIGTENVWNLPTFYNYGVGSSGFNARRELAANEKITEWALNSLKNSNVDACGNFPILYHSRIVPRNPKELTKDLEKELERIYNNWEKSDAVKDRLMGILAATQSIVMISEIFPSDLSTWLETLNETQFANALEKIDDSYFKILDFMHARGMYHFDGHFKNILVDPKTSEIYFTDFGLVICTDFDLSDAEREFLEKNKKYDKMVGEWSFVKAILRKFFGKEGFKEKIKEKLEDVNILVNQKDESGKLEKIMNKYFDNAVIFDKFINQLEKDKKTEFPSASFR